MSPDIRWKQRFSNYEKAFRSLSEAVALGSYDKLSQAGLIQMFELTFELGWKTLKDKLEYEGLDAQSPRETIKIAFRSEYIQNGELWIEALDDLNLISRTYDEVVSNQVRDLIRQKYFFLLKDLYEKFDEDYRTMETSMSLAHDRMRPV